MPKAVEIHVRVDTKRVVFSVRQQGFPDGANDSSRHTFLCLICSHFAGAFDLVSLGLLCLACLRDSIRYARTIRLNFEQRFGQSCRAAPIELDQIIVREIAPVGAVSLGLF